MEPCGNPGNQRFQILETGRKLLRQKGIICIWNTSAGLPSDGFGYLERTGRTLPTSCETRRPLHPQEAAGPRVGIRRPDSEARTEAFGGIAEPAEWRAVEGTAGSGRCVLHDIVLSDRLGRLAVAG